MTQTDIQDTPAEEATPANYYVKNRDMYYAIVESHEKGQCTDSLARMFMKIAEKYSHSKDFRSYESKYGTAFKQDMLASALRDCMRAWPKFNLFRSSNPLAYFTTVARNGFIGYLKKEYRYANIKNAYKVEQGMRGDYGYEEMMKRKEEEEAVEDEELYAEQLQSEEEEDEDYRHSNSEAVQEAFMKRAEERKKLIEGHERDIARGYKITNPLVESMKLWDDPVTESSKKPKRLSFEEMFGL